MFYVVGMFTISPFRLCSCRHYTRRISGIKQVLFQVFLRGHRIKFFFLPLSPHVSLALDNWITKHRLLVQKKEANTDTSCTDTGKIVLIYVLEL